MEEIGMKAACLTEPHTIAKNPLVVGVVRRPARDPQQVLRHMASEIKLRRTIPVFDQINVALQAVKTDRIGGAAIVIPSSGAGRILRGEPSATILAMSRIRVRISHSERKASIGSR